MSLSWRQRKTRLATLVLSTGDEDADGTAVDRLMHGQNAIGKTAKTAEIDSLRFQDKDLVVAGTLEHGQFGVIELVTCRHDNLVYVRKSTEKKFAIRTREQCSPQTERNILIAATLSDSPWVPHLLATYQMSTHLHFVMEYAEGGNLWDVLESSPHDGKIPESDLLWWTPQIVSAIHWCHSQGYAHRDIKPHNFVLTREGCVQLVDFGSAAPLLPPGPDGSQRLPRKHCLVPCGTCDYISPEILEAHEEALVALEMEDEDIIIKEVKQDPEGYGVETDWWSMGAMLYELAYGVAPFFANEIRHTYQRILNHERSLRFDTGVSSRMQDFLKKLLTHAHKRLGRHNVMEITDHPLFEETNWSTLTIQKPPPDLHVPQYTYSEPQVPVDPSAQVDEREDSDSYSQGFAFSAFFQSSQGSQSRSLSIYHNSFTPRSVKASPRDDPSSAFIGFTWGPHLDAFPDQGLGDSNEDQQSTPKRVATATPSPFRVLSTPVPAFIRFSPGRSVLSTPLPAGHHQFMTPVRPWAVSHSPMDTIRRTSTLRRTVTKREVSDREAMKQLVDCIGMSARKKVLESGRKPKILTTLNLSGKKTTNRSHSSRSRSGSGTYSSASHNASTSFRRVPSMKSLTDQTPEQPRRVSGRGTGGTTKTTTTNGTGTLRKELRFHPTPTPVPNKDYRPPDYETTVEDESGASMHAPSSRASNSRLAPLLLGQTGSAGITDAPNTSDMDRNKEDGGAGYVNYQYYSSSECTDSEGPPSPSPSPRPGSVASISKGSASAISRRSGTPTLTTMSSLSATSYRRRSGSGSNMSSLGMLSVPSPSNASGYKPWEGDEDKVTSPQETLGRLHPITSLKRTSLLNSSPGQRVTPPSEPQRPQVFERQSDSSSGDWEDMQARHERMMYDINQLEQRLKFIYQSTGGRDGRGFTHRH